MDITMTEEEFLDIYATFRVHYEAVSYTHLTLPTKA